MNRREMVLKKLHQLPDNEVEEAIKNLTKHVCARLRFGSFFDRTKFGAHSEQRLGMEPVDYYVGESITRLYDPNGWDWKFETLSLSQQLTRIANKLMSDQVEKYKRERGKSPLPVDKDVGEYYDLADEQIDGEDWFEVACDKFIELALKLSEDDDNLFCFTTLFFDGYKYETIAKELKIEVKDIYVLHKKLLRRLMKHKQKLLEK